MGGGYGVWHAVGNDGNGLTVLGVDDGYGHAVFTRMWENKFARISSAPEERDSASSGPPPAW